MGLFGPSTRAQARAIRARHARQEAAAKAAKKARKAHRQKFGRGPGIVCGWADQDDGRGFWSD